MAQSRNIVWRVVKWFAIFLGSFIGLCLLMIILIQTPFGQGFLKDQAVKYLSNKLQTKVSIDYLHIDFRKGITLKGISLEDQQKRRLLYGRELIVEYELSALLNKNLVLHDVHIKGVEVNIFRAANSEDFNFSFITKAFESRDEIPDTKEPSSFLINLGKLGLDSVSLFMDDLYGGQQYRAFIHQLNTDLTKSDIDKMHFHAGYLFADGLTANIQLRETGRPDPVDRDTSSSTFSFIADTINLAKLNVRYSTTKDEMRSETKLGNLSATKLNYNALDQFAGAGLIVLTNHQTELQIRSAQGKPALVPPDTTMLTKPYTFRVDSISIDKNSFSYNDLAYPKSNAKALDYKHIGLTDVNTHLSGVAYNGKTYLAGISDFSLKESSGFSLSQMQGKISYSDSLIDIKNLFLKTPYNEIRSDVHVTALKGSKSQMDDYLIKASLSSPGIRLQEALYFQPELSKNEYFRPLLDKIIKINTKIQGKLSNLHIPELVLSASSTNIVASADIFHLPDTKRMVIDLKLKELSGTKNGLLALLPKGTIPDSLLHYIPETFSIKGTYKGGLDNMNTDLQLRSSLGNATIKGTLTNPSDLNRAAYNMSVGIQDLDLGKLLGDTMLGVINGKVKAKGKGFDPRTAVATYQIDLNNAFYNGYTYRNLNVEGNIDHNLINATVLSADPNMDLSSEFRFNLTEGSRSFNTTTQVTHVDLRALGFTSDSIALKGNITADFPQLETSGITGNMLLTDAAIRFQSKQLMLDTVRIIALNQADTQMISLNTPLAELNLTGKYKPKDIAPAINRVINHYLRMENSDTAFTSDVQAELTGQVHIPDSVIAMIEGFKSIGAFDLAGSIDTRKDLLRFGSVIPKIKYGEVELDSLSVLLTTVRPDGSPLNNMQFAASINKLTGPSYELKKTYLRGDALNGIVHAQLELQDDQNKPRYLLPVTFTNDSERPSVSIGDSLMLNQHYWSVSKDNRVYIDPKRLSGSRLKLGYKESLIEFLSSEDNQEGLPLQFNFKSFNLTDIGKLLIADTAFIKGMLNGHLEIGSLTPFTFTTATTIDSLELFKAKLGNLKTEVYQKEAGLYAVNTSLNSDKNEVTLKGSYRAESKSGLLDLHIGQIDLATIKPALSAYVTDMKGKIKGDLTIQGNFEQPEVRGKINTDSVMAIYALTGTYLRLPAEQVLFDEEGIRFPDITIVDSLGHTGKVSGLVRTKDYKHFDIDLALTTKDYEIVGRKKLAGQGIYGPTRADLNLKLTGNEKAMSIDGAVDVKDKSEFTYILKSDTYDQIGEGLVEFFDPSKPVDTTVKIIGKSTLGFQVLMNMYINVTPSSTVTIITDEVSGDHLNAKGKAELNFTMKPGGVQELTGLYNLDGGVYELSLAGLIRRKFMIEKGSTILWSGDPLKGMMNITAKYETRTSAGELVNDIDQIPGVDKQKLNFDVFIILKNELLKPDISFKLDMDETDRQAFNGVIYSRIKQVNAIPSELNKQVMGLLAFNAFIAENPFTSFSSAAGDYSTQAFNTAGKILTQELTDLVGKYVKDVNIDFGLNQEKDYTSGKEIQRTDLTVGLTKSFANNRLNVYVGSSFALEGTNQSASSLSGLAGDITLEYLLSDDGRYRLKGYRLTDNEMIFQGNIVRTGVSFVVVLEFNKFKDMFRKRKSS